MIEVPGASSRPRVGSGGATAAAPSDAADLLSIRHLSCRFESDAGWIKPVDDVSFSLASGKTLGVVGESGAGKSMLARALMGITPRSAAVTGEVCINGVDITKLSKRKHREVLGAAIALVFQDPVTSLSPVVPVGRQITDGMRFHDKLSGREMRARAIDLLQQVGISDPARRFGEYPHQMSGGMRQRATIAAALACNPKILIADEATTALDVTVQKQVLDLLQEIQANRHMGMILISHDLGVVAGRTDDIIVMYAGQIVEKGPTKLLFSDHRHRYTASMLRSMPRLTHVPHTRLPTIPGSPPQLASLPSGCRFAPRCDSATPECLAADPALAESVAGHLYKCINPVTRSEALDLTVESAAVEGSS